MNLQSALENVAKVFIVFYISCAIAGRLDLPMMLITALQARSLASISSNWDARRSTKKLVTSMTPVIIKTDKLCPTASALFINLFNMLPPQEVVIY